MQIFFQQCYRFWTKNKFFVHDSKKKKIDRDSESKNQFDFIAKSISGKLIFKLSSSDRRIYNVYLQNQLKLIDGW